MMFKRGLNAMCTVGSLIAATVTSTAARAQDANWIELYGFAMADGDCYDPRLAELSWELVSDFLARELAND